MQCLNLHCRWQHLPTMMATRMPLILCSTTFSISGFGPLDMTVKALAWVTDRTVAALSQGTPKIEEIPPMVTRMSRSQWKPDPFTIFLSGLLTISLTIQKRELKMLMLLSHEVTLTLWWCYLRCHSRSDLGLQEDEDEDEQRRYTAGSHHPDREILLFSHRVDEPASGFGVGHLNTFWHNQFLKGNEISSEIWIQDLHADSLCILRSNECGWRSKSRITTDFFGLLALLFTFYWPTCPWIQHISQLNHKW